MGRNVCHQREPVYESVTFINNKRWARIVGMSCGQPPPACVCSRIASISVRASAFRLHSGCVLDTERFRAFPPSNRNRQRSPVAPARRLGTAIARNALRASDIPQAWPFPRNGQLSFLTNGEIADARQKLQWRPNAPLVRGCAPGALASNRFGETGVRPVESRRVQTFPP